MATRTTCDGACGGTNLVVGQVVVQVVIPAPGGGTHATAAAADTCAEDRDVTIDRLWAEVRVKLLAVI